MTANSAHVSGRVVAAFGRQFLVDTVAGERLRCVPRGKRSAYACGDVVFVARTGPGEGVIEAADPRASLFLRAAPHRQKVIAANATQVAVIVAGEPTASDELVCRILIAAECLRFRAFIVLNKIDLAIATDSARARLGPFAAAGYEIVPISAKQNVGPLRPRLAGETTVLIGQSGMGKSTVVNALVPDAAAATQEISRFLDSGRHTTTASRLYQLDASTAIVDSPGVQEFGLAHLAPSDIESGFRELAPLAGRCRFPDCRHRAEPGCAVRIAVDAGAVHPRRLELLHRILGAERATRR